MTFMRAKFQVEAIVRVYEGCEAVEMRAVGPGQYPEDGSDEDNTYAKFTPSGKLDLAIQNPSLLGKMKLGDLFYLDFTPAQEKTTKTAE